MKKYLYTLITAGLIFGASILPAKAYADCTQIYGGGQVCPPSYNFSIQKFVQTPGKGGGNFVNNLSINDPKYSPDGQVNFEIVVQNTGSNTIPALTINDTFPQYLNFVSGPGNFNTNNETLTFTINNLNPGQSQTFDVSGRVFDTSLLPSDEGTICLVNQATGTDSNGDTNTSSSQFCVQQNVLAASVPQVFATPQVVATPPTGPEMLPLLALLPGGLGGLILRRKSNNKSMFKGGEK